MNNIKILIVDDEESNAALLEALLSHEGYILSFAKNGEQALEKLLLDEPDLVLLDIMMPGISGFSVLQAIRKNKKTSALSVILLTSLTGRADRIKGINAGADDFITKPFDKEELLSRVKTHANLSILRRQIHEKEQLAGVMDLMREGAAVTDDSFNIQHINNTAVEMLGLAEKPVNLADFLLIAYGFDIDRIIDMSRTTISKTEQNTNSPLFLNMEYHKIIKNGEEMGSYVFIFKDATEQHTRNKIILDYLSVVSHKLQTPMSVISGYVKILDFFAADEKLKGSVKSIMRNSMIMENLLKRILYYVELEGVPASGALKPFNLKALIDGLVLKYNKPCELAGSPDELNLQYWQKISAEEIIENAFKYNDKAKLILKVKFEANELTIEDNGPGIAWEEREKVFEIFYEINRNLPGNMSSPGLGLSIVKRLAESAHQIVRLDTSEYGGLKVVICKKQ